MKEIITSTTKTVIVIWFWLWLESYWLALFIWGVIWLFFFSWIDICYWYYLAHRRWIVTSSILSDGMMRKLFQIIVSAARWIMCYWVSHAINVETIDYILSILAVLPLFWFLYAQVSSLVENLWVNAKDDEKRWITIMMQFFWIGKRRLEHKIKKYSDLLPTEQ